MLVAAAVFSLSFFAPVRVPPAVTAATTTKAAVVDRQDKIKALAAIVKIWPAYAAPGNPYGQMLGMGAVGILFELAGVDPRLPPAEQQKALAPLIAELKTAGVDVSGPLAPVLDSFRRFECRSKQSEAKANLKALYVGEESFRAENDRYDNDFTKLGFTPRGSTIRYRYEVVSSSDKAFFARAIGIGEMTGDEWTISQENDLKNTKPLCPSDP
jgi:hypothetical protein